MSRGIQMKKTVAAALLILLVAAQAGFAQQADKAGNKPELKLIESKYEFKSITEGVEIIHDFKVKNTGTAPLEILRVRPG